MDAGGVVGTEVVARGEWVSDTGGAVWKAVEHIAAWVGPDPCDDCSERGEAVEHIAAWAGPDPCDDCSERGAEGTWMRSAAVGVMAKGGSSRSGRMYVLFRKMGSKNLFDFLIIHEFRSLLWSIPQRRRSQHTERTDPS